MIRKLTRTRHTTLGKITMIAYQLAILPIFDNRQVRTIITNAYTFLVIHPNNYRGHITPQTMVVRNAEVSGI